MDIILSIPSRVLESIERSNDKVATLREFTTCARKHLKPIKDATCSEEHRVRKLISHISLSSGAVRQELLAKEKSLSTWSRFWLEVKRGLGLISNPWVEIQKAQWLIHEMEFLASCENEIPDRVAKIKAGIAKIEGRHPGSKIQISEEEIVQMARFALLAQHKPQETWHGTQKTKLARSIYQKGTECYLLLGKRQSQKDPVLIEEIRLKSPKYFIDMRTGEIDVYATMQFDPTNKEARKENANELDGLKSFGNKPGMIKYIAIAKHRTGKKGKAKQTVFLHLYKKLDLHENRAVIKDLPFQKQLTLFLSMATSIKYMHDRGYAHRDIKPENYFVDEDLLNPHLGDFGFQVKVPSDGIYTGEKLGTPHYVALENAFGIPNDGFPADVWSLGCSFCYLLTGKDVKHGEKYACHMSQKQLDAWCNNELMGQEPALVNLIKNMLRLSSRERISIQKVVEQLERGLLFVNKLEQQAESRLHLLEN